jgi:TolB protein
LKFDLLFMGFTNVPPDQAQFQLTGSDAGQIKAQLVEVGNKMVHLNLAYSGGSLRHQAHKLSDDVASKLTERPPIAQTRILFKVKQDRTSEIFMADYDGANPVRVTHDNNIVAAPAWVPRRNAILYASYKLGPIFVLYHDLATGQRRNITPYPGSNMTPAASPDGTRVAMVLSKSGSPDIYVANIDGSNLKRLTTWTEDESSPCWSPDGGTICFASRQSGTAALYTMPASGGTPKRLSTVGVFNAATEPDWSPDGKFIAFATQTRGGFDLCVVRATGGEVFRVVDGEDPSWAPNSRAIAFVRRVGNRKVLSLLDVPTKQVKDARQISGENSQPCWSK